MSDALASFFRQDKDAFEKGHWGRVGSVDVVRSERGFNETRWLVGLVIGDELREPIWLSNERGHFSEVRLGAVVWPENKTKLQPSRAFDGLTSFDHDA